ncbi:MAG: SDR family oxidoreductase [Ignavibacteriales bacterium]|nr:SDR family oxidoreductase [Ignavibacteriales bacterium]
MDLGLKNKVALVAAASHGLGRASALALAQEGAHLVICSRNEESVKKTAEEIREKTGATVVSVAADVSMKKDIQRFVQTAIREFGTVHVLVNNAGGPPTGHILSMSEEEWEKGIQLTLMSVIRLVREVLPLMEKQHWGRIVSIVSIAAKQPINELLVSSTVRPGILGLSKVLSNQYAKDNITVNTVCPGLIFTKRQEELSVSRAADKKMTLEEYLVDSAKAIPAGRLGSPEEIGNVVAFLASEQASYINGVNLLVDGGSARGIH